MSAGYTRYDTDAFREAIRSRGAVFTNASRVYADSCAEHVLAMMLALGRQLLPLFSTQRSDRASLISISPAAALGQHRLGGHLAAGISQPFDNRRRPDTMRGFNAAHLWGSEAQRLLDTPAFLEQWAALSDACPWGTCYQSAPFVTTWYRCYADQFDPVIATSESGGRLSGLFTLALEKSTGALHAAGTYHAEYHVWLAAPADSREFIDAALRSLSLAWPRAHLGLLFVPPNTPLDWTAHWRWQCALRPVSRPLMGTQPADAVRESLRKKSNKSRLSRLQKQGVVTFDRLSDSGELRAALEEIADFCDFRQGGAHGVLPFQGDPRKKNFYCSLMEQPGLLHATVLRVGGRIASAHIGQCNKNEVVLGILAHSPFFAGYSVGKLHLLLLGKQLETEGFRALDLTPGGEFKDRFATHHDEAYVLDLFFSRSDARAYHTERALIDFGKRFIETDRVKDALRKVRHKAALIRPPALAASLGRRLRRFFYSHREYRIYRFPADTVARPPAGRMRRDCLHDLLLYSPADLAAPSR